MTLGDHTISSNSSSRDVFVAKMNESGEWDFLVPIGSEHDHDSLIAVSPAPDGGVYVMMTFADEITVGEGTRTPHTRLARGIRAPAPPLTRQTS